MERLTLGISSCLYGEAVRYDGGHKHSPCLLESFGGHVRWVPVCPEVECGLPVPRDPMHLVGPPESPRLVTVETGLDHTQGMRKWAEEKLEKLKGENLSGFIFKSRSPSSGLRDAELHDESGRPAGKTSGIFAALFTERFPHLPAGDDRELSEPAGRENFLVRVFALGRWREFIEEDGGTPRGLIEFHERSKLLLMAHSPRHYRSLGGLVGNQKEHPGTREELLAEYLEGFTSALSLRATVKKHTNALEHAAGYFKKKLEPEEKRELLKAIASYHEGLLPLIVPVTLLNHYVRKYEEPYLGRQDYLNPSRLELILRNHA